MEKLRNKETISSGPLPHRAEHNLKAAVSFLRAGTTQHPEQELHSLQPGNLLWSCESSAQVPRMWDQKWVLADYQQKRANEKKPTLGIVPTAPSAQHDGQQSISAHVRSRSLSDTLTVCKLAQVHQNKAFVVVCGWALCSLKHQTAVPVVPRISNTGRHLPAFSSRALPSDPWCK